MTNPANAHRPLFSLAILSLATLLTLSVGTRVQAQDIQWQYDIDAAIKQAKAEQKLILLHFTASWCRPCQAMEKFVFRNLEVARLVEQNVVPVQIDVDHETTVVTEYGVTAVPYDVIITPGGRIVRKQKSPLDSNGYRRMMASLATAVKGVEDNSNSAVARQLADTENQFDFKPSKISEFQSFKPDTPSHDAPSTSHDSAELARRNRVQNPFFAEAAALAASTNTAKPAPVKQSNSFVTAPVQDNLQAKTAAQANGPRTIANRFAATPRSSQPVVPSLASPDAANQLASEVAATAANLPSRTMPRPPQLEAPKVSSDFQVMTGADVREEAFQLSQQNNQQAQAAAGQPAAPTLNPQVAPEMSYRANPGAQLTQLMNQAQKPSRPTPSQGFAANVTPNRIQQDRFFQDPAQPVAVDATRPLKPKRMAQQLLQPIKQYPAVATQKMKQVTGKVNNAFSAITKRGNPLVPNFGTTPQTTGNVVKPDVPAMQLAGQQPPRYQLTPQATSFPAAGQQPINGASGVVNASQPNGRMDQLLTSPATPPLPANIPVVAKTGMNSRSTPCLRGKCPVSLLQQGKWVDGDAKFGCVHRDRLYVFADAEKLKTFRADPDLFSPVLAGYDPVLFHENGHLVEGHAEHGVFMGQAPDQRILLFSGAQTRARFQKQPSAYLNTVRQAMNASGGGSSMIR